MRAFTIKAKNLESAQSLFDALRQFDPALEGTPSEGYCVSVNVGGQVRRIIDVLDTLQEHVLERQSAANVELDGRYYTFPSLGQGSA